MTYSDYFTHSEKKVPLPVLLVSVLVIIFILAKLMNASPPPSRAAKSILTKVEVVNLTSTTGAVYWQTVDKVKSWVLLGQSEGALTRRLLDERDVPESLGNRTNHFVEITDINPGTTYYYEIVIQDSKSTYLVKDPSGKAYLFTTSAQTNSTTANKPAYGKLVAPNNGPISDALVRLTFGSAYPQMTLTKSTGEWLIPLSGLTDKTTGMPITLKDTDSITLDLFTDDAVTMVHAVVAKVGPLPQTVILGTNYSFLNDNDVLSATDTFQAGGTKQITVLTPKEGAIIPGSTVLVRGTALPGTAVSLALKSTHELDYSVTADSQGIWQLSLSDALLPGLYTLTMKTKDENQKEVTVVRHFTIAKSGEEVLGSATSSATPTLTPAPTTFSNPTPTTAYNSYPTATPFTASAEASPPVTGSAGSLPWILTGGGILIMGFGVILAF